jgi:hypothetical protein
LPVEKFQDKWTAIPFQFAQELPGLQVPIGKESAIMKVQRNNDGWDQEFVFPVKNYASILRR